MFKRVATLEFKKILASEETGKYYWRDLVKTANQVLNTDNKFLPSDIYKVNTKKFIYIQARAISGGEKWGCNGNADYFPWQEIVKAVPTFLGKGFYLEHKEDSEQDAKGIILDAEPDMENEYVLCLVAIDREEYPDFVQKILSGELNQVSMSCLAATACCPVCGNVATSMAELCPHMNPNNPITYCKGRLDENGNMIYEINKDLCFTGLSAVAVPADKDAFVFDIKASKQKTDALKEEFTKYAELKQAGKMKAYKMACEEEMQKLTNYDLLNKLKMTVDNLTNTLSLQTPMLNTTPDIITPSLQNILEQVISLQVGLNMMELQDLNKADLECKNCETEKIQEPAIQVVPNVENTPANLSVATESQEINDNILNKQINCKKLKAMIIDDILDRRAGVPYNAKEFYKYVKFWVKNRSVGKNILDAFNSNNEENVKKALCEYVKDYGYKTSICRYINSVNWLENDLGKEIDSYLDGDNYSYTPFSSTANVKKQAGTWAIPDTKEKVQKLKDILKQPLPASEAKDKMYDLVGDDELFDEIDSYLETEPNEAMNNVIKHHLKRMQKCPLNKKSYNTKEKYEEALEAQKLWDTVLKDY